MATPRYALVVWKDPSEARLPDAHVRSITGLYQWLDVFKGDILSFRELDACSLEHYDVLHVNVCTRHARLPELIREKLGGSSSTKIVANLDYGFEMLEDVFADPNFTLGLALKGLKSADMVFSVDPYQADMLTQLGTANVEFIPHPCDTKRIKSFRRGEFERDDMIAVQYHREWPRTLYSSIVLDYEFSRRMEKVLYGYEPRARGLAQYAKFDDILGYMDFNEFLEEASRALIAFEPYQIHSAGRFTIDMACLGVPSVGSNMVYSMRKLWPELMVDAFDVYEARAKINKLLDDKEFYDDCVRFADETVEFYGHAASSARFMKALEVN